MLMLITATAFAAQTVVLGSDLFGRYLRTNLTTRPKCNQSNEHYLTISQDGILWEDGRYDPIISLNVASKDKFYIWTKDSASGIATLIGVYIDRKYDNAIVVSNEQVVTQAQIDQPGVADIGVVAYARCPA